MYLGGILLFIGTPMLLNSIYVLLIGIVMLFLKDSSTSREELFTVKEVISPEIIRLSNNLTIKLIGIKENPLVNGNATTYLIDKTKGNRVFLRYDSLKYDNENNLLCYLYLENKTFINAHLIKKGFVLVDNSYEFKYKQKFNPTCSLSILNPYKIRDDFF
jgi:site-specific DNA-methyltransferase (adenine-specific)